MDQAQVQDGWKIAKIFTVKPGQATPRDYINEVIIRKLNPLVVVDFRSISAFLNSLARWSQKFLPALFLKCL